MTDSKSAHVYVRDLPPMIAAALRASFGMGDTKTVEVEARESASIGGGAAFKGNRAMAVLVNLKTGERSARMGSWGGSNPFESNPIDKPSTLAIEPGFALIEGEAGYKAIARVLVHPSHFAQALPKGAGERAELSQAALTHLAVIAGYNSRGRREYFGRHGGPNAEAIGELERAGLVKVNKTGAVTITPAGRTEGKSRKLQTPY